jgi:hypothetical protein
VKAGNFVRNWFRRHVGQRIAQRARAFDRLFIGIEDRSDGGHKLGAPLGQGDGRLAQRGRQDQCLRARIIEDICRLIRLEVRRDQGHENAAPGCPPIGDCEIGAVAHHQSDAITRHKAQRTQQLGKAVRPIIELAVGQRLAGIGDHERQVIGRITSVNRWVIPGHGAGFLSCWSTWRFYAA